MIQSLDGRPNAYQVYTNELYIAYQFYHNLTNIGTSYTLASSIINTVNDDPTKYVNNTPKNSSYLLIVAKEYTP